MEVLSSQGIIPGIKVDKSTKPLAGADGEVITEGLDGLRDRLAEYAGLGAKFTKWRSVITIGDGIPTRRCIEANAQALARFATLSQEAGLVPDRGAGGPHGRRPRTSTPATRSRRTRLREVYYELGTHRVTLEGTLLKPNMVLSGKDASDRAGPERVAEMTVQCFLNTVPAAVPGVVFLSGGQSDDEATVNLDAINRYAAARGAPWELSFSYGRGLQAAHAQSVGRRCREHPGGAGGLLSPREGHVGSAEGRVHGGDGIGGRERGCERIGVSGGRVVVGGWRRGPR